MKEKCESDGDEAGKGKRDGARTDKLGCRWIGRAANRGYKWAKHRSVRMPRSRLQVARPPINMSAGNTTARCGAAHRVASRRIAPSRVEPRLAGRYHDMAMSKSHGIPRRVPHRTSQFSSPLRVRFPSLSPLLSFLALSTHFFFSLLSLFPSYPSIFFHPVSSFLSSSPFHLSSLYRRISFLRWTLPLPFSFSNDSGPALLYI